MSIIEEIILNKLNDFSVEDRFKCRVIISKKLYKLISYKELNKFCNTETRHRLYVSEYSQADIVITTCYTYKPLGVIEINLEEELNEYKSN